jgi:hypothetical protein
LEKSINEKNEKDAFASQLELLPSSSGEEWAFDEMNLVELPFCLLQKTNKGRTSIPLSSNGGEYLKCSDENFGLPTAMAEPVLLGLLGLSMDRYGFKERIFSFSLRDLVERYSFPEKYKKYRAGGKLMTSVEQELHRIAATRLYSKRWYDKGLQKQVPIDAAIIDYIKIVDEGGGNSPRMIEIAWGTALFESVQSRYTKELDWNMYQKIERPLDRRLYRWLDRQLSIKDKELCKSIQNFGRYKMLMQGNLIDKGGRTASSYILKNLKDALQRLNGLGFAVRMTPDVTKPDFSLTFEKIAGNRNEIVECDPVGDLIREFNYYFHNVSRDSKKRRFREADREFAAQWIEAYGYDQSVWMVNKCNELHGRSPKADQKIYYFKGLETYEPAACSAFENHLKEAAGQQRLKIEETRRNLWGAYEEIMLGEAERQISTEKEAELSTQARELAKRRLPQNTPPSNIETFIGPLYRIELKNLKMTAINAMSQDEFNSFKSNVELEEALTKRHGYNPLKK